MGREGRGVERRGRLAALYSEKAAAGREREREQLGWLIRYPAPGKGALV